MENRMLLLVDMEDRPLGLAEKMEAHRKGLLHRAFSLFLLDGVGRLLLQRRAMKKYHSPGLWTNACCGHPAPGYALVDFAGLRAREELGVRAEQVQAAGSFLYYRDFGSGLKEYELDHVLVGRTTGPVQADPAEAMDTAWVDLSWAAEDLRLHPARYTAWYPTAFGLAWPLMKGMVDKWGKTQ